MVETPGLQAPQRQPQPVRCREIGAADIGQVVGLLTEGFQAWRDRAFWVNVLNRLAQHPAPSGFPQYGYLLESGRAVVGALLLIVTSVEHGDEPHVRCNVSSWYVKPEFRSYGTFLSSRAQRHRQATYVNLTAAPWTWASLEAQGYVRYCRGAMYSVPILSARAGLGSVGEAATGLVHGSDLRPSEVDLLLGHAAYGCLSLICSSSDGRHPFVFAVRRRFHVLRYAVLIYSRSQDEFVRFAGPLGRFLARRGVFILVLNADSSIAGLKGVFSAKYPKYFKGEHRPGLCDLAFSERALFGV